MPEFEPWFTFAHWTLRPPVSLWFNWRFEGMEHIPPEGPVLVATNHISYFDPIAHAYMFVKAGRRPRFLGKRELFDTPLLGTVLRGAHQIPVDRGSGSTAPLQAALEALDHGELVVVYPEATVTKNADFMPMKGKTGTARLALDAEIPVLPVAVWGSQHIWQKAGHGDMRFGRPIWLKTGAPIDLTEYESSKDSIATLRTVTNVIMDEIHALVVDLASAYPRRWA